MEGLVQWWSPGLPDFSSHAVTFSKKKGKYAAPLSSIWTGSRWIRLLGFDGSFQLLSQSNHTCSWCFSDRTLLWLCMTSKWTVSCISAKHEFYKSQVYNDWWSTQEFKMYLLKQLRHVGCSPLPNLWINILARSLQSSVDMPSGNCCGSLKPTGLEISLIRSGCREVLAIAQLLHDKFGILETSFGCNHRHTTCCVKNCISPTDPSFRLLYARSLSIP